MTSPEPARASLDAPYADLCKLFDSETKDGTDMACHSALLENAVAAIAAQFGRKNASNIFTSRSGKLIDTATQVKSSDDFELITWLIIK